MTTVDASMTPREWQTHQEPRHVAVVGSEARAVQRIRRWLAPSAGAPGHYRYHPHCWDPRSIRHLADNEGRIKMLNTALDTVLPGRDNVLSWYATPAETEAVTDLLLGVIPPGGTWIGLGPLPLPAARGLADRAAAVGVTYLHAPLVQAPATADEEQSPALVYQSSQAGAEAWTHGLLASLASHLAWMGDLGHRPSGPA